MNSNSNKIKCPKCKQNNMVICFDEIYKQGNDILRCDNCKNIIFIKDIKNYIGLYEEVISKLDGDKIGKDILNRILNK